MKYIRKIGMAMLVFMCIMYINSLNTKAATVSVTETIRYVKIDAEKPKLINVSSSLQGKETVKVRLCNSKKVMISEKIAKLSAKKESTKYFIQKGVYYLCLQSDIGQQKVKYTIETKQQDGKEDENNAKSLKKGAEEREGVLGVGRSKEICHYYKFELKEAQKVNLVVKKQRAGNDSDVLYITIYKKGKTDKDGETVALYMGQTSGTIALPNSGGKWKKGIYYIQVKKYSENAGMGYSIRWK